MNLPFKFKKLNVRVDLDQLKKELEGIPEEWWICHEFHGTRDETVLLLSQNGTLINPDGSDNHSFIPPFKPTSYLEKLPYFKKVIFSFGVEPSRTKLNRIPPGGVIEVHQDRNPHFRDKFRLHIPIKTHPDVRLHVWRDDPNLPEEHHETAHMGEGEVTALNTWFFPRSQKSVTDSTDSFDN